MKILFTKIIIILVFAVGTDKGLVVPVLKNSDELSFADIEKKH